MQVALRFLVQPTQSPSRLRLENHIRGAMPQAQWHAYEPVDFEEPRAATLPL